MDLNELVVQQIINSEKEKSAMVLMKDLKALAQQKINLIMDINQRSIL